ncbi:MAG TPA: hypothetical protein VIV40_39055 [Kofleriaceae bacterium]
MQRIACLLIGITAACGGGTDSGPASLTGTTPPGKSVGARTFEGADGAGNMVLGWKLEFFEQGPGADCLSEDTKVVASVGIYTNQAAGSKPQAILPLGEVPIVTTSPPVVNGQYAATMSAQGVVITSGAVSITEFHLTPDAMHADRIKGMVNAGGMDGGTGASIAVTGAFDAPYCPE